MIFDVQISEQADRDLRGIFEYIAFEKAKRTCNDTLYSLNEEHYKKIKESHFFWLERNGKRNISETVQLVEEHFGWHHLYTKNI